MASRIHIENGIATAVYDDRFRPLLEALGRMQVRRASEVEYDAVSGDWVARRIVNGVVTDDVMARGPNREQVIKDEVAYLEARLGH